MKHLVYRMALIVTVLACVPAVTAQGPVPPRGIVRITGDLYRAQNNNHYNVFLVTPDGIIMTDPIDRDFSRWLQAGESLAFRVHRRAI